ncbi:MAG: AbrB family transcriptional regulator [Roseovarius sp.]|uniref:AbrB family transcriptional regulator n=1 Tax=Roseovarius sp. TaxID=1486281 RepID=UPI0032F07586
MANILVTFGLICLGALTGWAASLLGLPLPYLIGPLLICAAIATILPHRLPEGYRFSHRLRTIFTGVIGLMIGAQVTPELFAQAPEFVITFTALTLFVGVCLAFNFWVFRRLGGYDRVTAFYSSTPGGLYESLALGEAAGGDVARLTLQQFLRVIVVVTALPVGLSLWLGEPVGSSGGVTLARDDVPWTDLPYIVLAGAAGYFGGRLLRFPAAQLTGPMAAAAILSVTGFFHVDIPVWLVNIAQIIVGCALGMRFTGLSRGLILRGAGLSLLSVGGMLVLALVFAVAVVPFVAEPIDVLLISFAPGGVTEMSLVALSLQANPAFVTLHHIFRILMTVIWLMASAPWVRRNF